MPTRPPKQSRKTAPSAYKPDIRRGSARERGYTTGWDKARLGHLRDHPFCIMCEAKQVARLATVVDHVIPHRGDQTLFWDRGNWASLCTHHHNSAKQREERRSLTE